jgi:phage terminase small subunit
MANHPHDKDRPESAAVRHALAKGDMAALRLALTPRQRRFAEEYIVDFNGAAAAVRAGYSLNYPDRMASTLTKHAGVAALIDHLTASKEAKVMSVNPDYVIQKVTEIVTKPESRDGDKLRGLELLARHLGMFIDRTEITGKDGGAIEVEQRKIEEEAQNFTRLMKALQERNAAEKKDVSLL